MIQTLDTWVSKSDIDKGQVWFASITESLVKAEGMGIFCLTEENLKVPWLAYEAGALASHDQGSVATFLHGVKAGEVAPPLGLFQATDSSSKGDVFLLVKTINNRLNSPLFELRLQKAFETHWQSLADHLAIIGASGVAKPLVDETSRQDTLNEILAVVR